MTSQLPVVGFTTTPRFREHHYSDLENVVETHLLWLAENTTILVTGSTYDVVCEIVKKLGSANKYTESNVSLVLSKLVKLPPQSIGIVALTHELIEGRLSAVFHLSHYKDIHSTFAGSVLRRQSIVHNVIYADTVQTSSHIINSWRTGTVPIQSRSTLPTTVPTVPIAKLKGSNNIALIAHDGKKLDMCLMALQNLNVLLSYDHILATGTTGTWLKKFITAACTNNPAIKLAAEAINEKMILCESGPKGGDVQIAHVCLSGLCNKIIFFIDPMTAHPHEPDIRFFEQVVEASKDFPVQLATNPQSAQFVLCPK
mmetsp:Transcript_28963/g.40765  ORF Transcript_28963/g.40765 Transcript_28963/m.40765 type:complete len:313 (-) Transcript_28963:127-1065(-)